MSLGISALSHGVIVGEYTRNEWFCLDPSASTVHQICKFSSDPCQPPCLGHPQLNVCNVIGL